MSSTIIPTLRYRDARAMVEWLQKAFGFQPHMVVDPGDGDIAHAQLTFGTGMIMLSSAQENEFGEYQKTPKDLGGTTQSPYIVAEDIDALFASAKAAGAEIVMDLESQDYGGKLFSCRDPEGHLWNFGSYDPWAKPQ